MNSRLWKSNGMLLLTAAIWGFAFVAQRVGMEYVGPFTFNAVRFSLGSLALLPLLYFTRRRTPASQPRALLQAGIQAGVVLFVAASLQQIGMVYTTAGKGGFITGLYVIFVLLLGTLLGRRARAWAWLGALLALIGLYLLSMLDSLTLELGDALVLGGAFFWAIHVLLIDHWSGRVNPVALAATQFAVCAALGWLAALATETITLEGLQGAGYAILYGGLLSVGVAYTLQVVAQRDAHPTHAAIILSLEAAFAALGGWLLLGETLGARGLLGCGLMLVGMLCAQLGGASASAEV